MRSTASNVSHDEEPAQPVPVVQPKKPESKEETTVVTQLDLDIIEEKFKQKETLVNSFIEPANPLLDSYKKKLLQSDPEFEPETIVYDTQTGTWKITKVSEQSDLI
jgi:hypothetical protein